MCVYVWACVLRTISIFIFFNNFFHRCLLLILFMVSSFRHFSFSFIFVFASPLVIGVAEQRMSLQCKEIVKMFCKIASASGYTHILPLRIFFRHFHLFIHVFYVPEMVCLVCDWQFLLAWIESLIRLFVHIHFLIHDVFDMILNAHWIGISSWMFSFPAIFLVLFGRSLNSTQSYTQKRCRM